MDAKTSKKNAKEFAKQWKQRGYEKGDTQSFWLQLLGDVVGMTSVTAKCKFEYRTSDGGFIDVWIPDCSVLVEQKSLGIDLDKPELRQGKEVTPLEQALGYVRSLPFGQQPRYLVTCNFETFRVYDRQNHNDKELTDHPFEFKLAEIASNPSLLSFITDPTASRSEREKQVSMKV